MIHDCAGGGIEALESVCLEMARVRQQMPYRTGRRIVQATAVVTVIANQSDDVRAGGGVVWPCGGWQVGFAQTFELQQYLPLRKAESGVGKSVSLIRDGVGWYGNGNGNGVNTDGCHVEGFRAMDETMGWMGGWMGMTRESESENENENENADGDIPDAGGEGEDCLGRDGIHVYRVEGTRHLPRLLLDRNRDRDRDRDRDS